MDIYFSSMTFKFQLCGIKKNSSCRAPLLPAEGYQVNIGEALGAGAGYEM